MTRHPSMRELLAVPGSEQPLAPAPLAARPVITISRDPGSRGRELAYALGEKLSLPVYDRELIHRIAKSTQVEEQIVSFLDEKPRSLLTDWMCSMEPSGAYLSPYLYFQHLVSAVQAIHRRGAAVILGRGAHLILDAGQALRVLVTAPYADRVRTVAARESVDLAEARKRVARAEAERRAFLEKYFRVRVVEPSSFDLVLNTSALGVAGCVDVVCAALARIEHELPVARTG